MIIDYSLTQAGNDDVEFLHAVVAQLHYDRLMHRLDMLNY